MVLVAIRNVVVTGNGAVLAYRLGDWPAPFGIVLVLDRLSATMVLLASVLALLVAIHAASGWDRRGRHFHPLLQFQAMGVNGAFLTGDVFNLFVFFEVMLIASYGLMLHGGGPRRLVGGFQYVAINLIGSTLFLFAVGVIYAVTGTLNMADLAVKVPLVAPGDAALLAAGGLMLMLVFCLKAALAPLHWWLPTAYSAASPPAAAMFMIMTKVGAYSLLRLYTLVFGVDAGAVAGLAHPWLMPAALVTIALGAVGALAGRTLSTLVCFSTVWSMGSLLVAVGLFDAQGLASAVYYILHSTMAGAALFLLLDLRARAARGRAGCAEAIARVRRPGLARRHVFRRRDRARGAAAAIRLRRQAAHPGGDVELAVGGLDLGHPAGLEPPRHRGPGAGRQRAFLEERGRSGRGGFAGASGRSARAACDDGRAAGRHRAAVGLRRPADAARDRYGRRPAATVALHRGGAGTKEDGGCRGDAMTGFMTRLVPQPIVSLVLAAVWLLLVNDVSAGNIVLGLAIGFLVPLLTSPYWPDRTLPRRPFGLVAYVLIVLWDVVLSNFHVARLVLFRRGESLKSRFVTVPIELQSAEAIAILSATITMTPGTVTADLSSDGSKLLVHCLDAEDPDAVVAGIKSRYERRLKEIFE